MFFFFFLCRWCADKNTTSARFFFFFFLFRLPSQDAQEAPAAQESDKDKAFIALQLPTTRKINEDMANQLFTVLENGGESRLLLQRCRDSRWRWCRCWTRHDCLASSARGAANHKRNLSRQESGQV